MFTLFFAVLAVAPPARIELATLALGKPMSYLRHTGLAPVTESGLGLGVRPGVDVAIGGVLRVVLVLVDAARAPVAGGTALAVLGEV